jgi:hypothetical protein
MQRRAKTCLVADGRHLDQPELHRGIGVRQQDDLAADHRQRAVDDLRACSSLRTERDNQQRRSPP